MKETQTAKLRLDPEGNRTVEITAPIVVTIQEMERIQSWIGLQILVDGEEAAKELLARIEENGPSHRIF